MQPAVHDAGGRFFRSGLTRYKPDSAQIIMREQYAVLTRTDMLEIIPDNLRKILDTEAGRILDGIIGIINYSTDIRMEYHGDRLSLSSADSEEYAKKLFEYQLQEDSLLNGVLGMKVRHGKDNESLLHYIRRKASRRLIEENERDIVRRVRNRYFLESGSGRDNGPGNRGGGRRDGRHADGGFYWPDAFDIYGMQTDRKGLGSTLLVGYLVSQIGRSTRILRASAARFQLMDVTGMLDLYDSVGFSAPAHIPDLFPEARKIRRHFIIHVGGTNTGKTYDSMRMLAQAPSGVYLCPLRMLAYEGREVIRNWGVPCSFATGEEKEIDPGAKHMSETIGMLDFSHPYDCAVIDECQLISGEDGSLYTNAILGVNAKTVCVCCAYSGLEITKRLIELCGDTWEVTEHHRTSELKFEEEEYEAPRKNDAYIVFSRLGAYQMAEWLEEKGMTPSIVYGKLPYEVKMEEARKFEAGETDCLVATDAIAIGQNYNIERIVFRDVTKFINRREIRLDSQTVKQVAGRAGRYGRFPVGYVNTLRSSDREEILSKLKEEDVPSSTAPLELPSFLVEKDLPLSLIYRAWTSSEAGEPFVKADTTTELVICRLIEEEFSLISKADEYTLASLPLDLRDRTQIELLRQFLGAMLRPTSDKEWKSLLPQPDMIKAMMAYRPHLRDCEKLCRDLDLASSFFYKIRRDDLAEYVIRLKPAVTKRIAQIMAEEIPQTAPGEDPELKEDTSSWPMAYIYVSLSGQTERNTGRFPSGDFAKLYSHRLEQSFGNEASYIDYYCYKKKDRTPDYCRFEPYLRYTVRLDPQFIISDEGRYYLAERFEVVKSDYKEAASPYRSQSYRNRRPRGRGRRRR